MLCSFVFSNISERWMLLCTESSSGPSGRARRRQKNEILSPKNVQPSGQPSRLENIFFQSKLDCFCLVHFNEKYHFESMYYCLKPIIILTTRHACRMRKTRTGIVTWRSCCSFICWDTRRYMQKKKKNTFASFSDLLPVARPSEHGSWDTQMHAYTHTLYLGCAVFEM
jgi:hypothetical protein